MKTKIFRFSYILFALGITMSFLAHQHLLQSSITNPSSLIGGSKFWAGLACGASVGGLVFAAPTGVLLAATVVAVIGTCGDAFFG